jgi:signal transduction histidine kinase
MSETIDEFRNMLKPDKLSESFPLAAKTGEAVAIFQSQLASSRIKFEMIGGDTPEIMVEGFQGQYKQAVLNLVSNARHAIDERRAREEGNAPQGRIGIVMECCKGNAVIRFNDNGCGISPEVRERIFDPYFTTKPEGVGTGIGLYTARMIIENSMGGSLLLAESRPGEGSSFVITLPVTGSLGRNSTFPT